MRKINYIIIHCSDSKPSMVSVDAKEIDRWHRLRGFLSIGYHFVIKRDGKLETGRKLDQVGAHCQGYNTDSVGICLVGGMSEKGKPENNFTEVQMLALHNLVQSLQKQFKGAKVVGHRDMPGVKKECPCFNVKEWYEEITANKED